MKRSTDSSCFARRPRFPFVRLGISGRSLQPWVRMIRYCLRTIRYLASVSVLVVLLIHPVAGLAQQPLHQVRPAEAVGREDEGQLPEQVAAAQLMPALVVGKVCRPAVVDQRAGVARDDTDFFDRLLTALLVPELQRQTPVGDDMEPLGSAVDPEAGFVGVQSQAFQKMRDRDRLP